MAATEEEFKNRVRKRAEEEGVEITEQHEELLDRMAPDVIDRLEESNAEIGDWFESKKSDWLT